MSTEIYGDYYFLINFSMDCLCLYICSVLICVRAKKRRTALGGTIGGLWSLLILYLDMNDLPALILSLPVGLIIVYVTFGRRRLFTNFAVFSGVSMLTGGIMTFVFNLMYGTLRFSDLPTPRAAYVFCGLLCAALSYILSRLSKNRMKREKCDISIDHRHIHINGDGLVDSGNIVREPISGMSVVILSKELSDRFFAGDDRLSGASGKDSPISDSIRLIPYTSPDGNHGILVGFIPECITINGLERRSAVALSDHESFGDCQALVPPELTD